MSKGFKGSDAGGWKGENQEDGWGSIQHLNAPHGQQENGWSDQQGTQDEWPTLHTRQEAPQDAQSQQKWSNYNAQKPYGRPSNMGGNGGGRNNSQFNSSGGSSSQHRNHVDAPSRGSGESYQGQGFNQSQQSNGSFAGYKGLSKQPAPGNDWQDKQGGEWGTLDDEAGKSPWTQAQNSWGHAGGGAAPSEHQSRAPLPENSSFRAGNFRTQSLQRPAFGQSVPAGGGIAGTSWPQPTAGQDSYDDFGLPQSSGQKHGRGSMGFNNANNRKSMDEVGLRRMASNYKSHNPLVRTVEQLYIEDEKQAAFYSRITDEDEEVTVAGGGQVAAVLGSWEDANFRPELLNNVKRSGYVRPRKIQAYSIPLIIDGRDVKGQSETGSGKTAAFLLPIIDRLMRMDRSTGGTVFKPRPFAVIVEPTRELCLQVFEQGQKLVNGTGVTMAKSYGDYPVRDNLRELNSGCDILCITTGRLIHFFTANMIKLDRLKFLVLDEADALLDGSFLDDLSELFTHPEFPKKEDRQTLLFSATFPDYVEKLCEEALRTEHAVVSNKKLVAANTRVTQDFLSVGEADKKEKLLELLETYLASASKENAPPRVLVFVRTKRDADMLAIYLSENKIQSVTINADRPQHLRESALKDLRDNRCSVLVATDVMARGIDIKDLDHVVNFDLPNDLITYVHRIGRTGRLKRGLATSFWDEGSLNDTNLATQLVTLIEEAGQTAPSFLTTFGQTKIEDMNPSGTVTGNNQETNPTSNDGWGS